MRVALEKCPYYRIYFPDFENSRKVCKKNILNMNRNDIALEKRRTIHIICMAQKVNKSKWAYARIESGEKN